MPNFCPLLFVVLFAAAGCASYQPAEISSLRPQEKIRLELEQTELARLIAFVDPATRSVSGRFVNEIGDSVAIIVETPLSYMQVSVPRSSIVQTRRRVVDNRKTFMFSALMVGGVAALAVVGFEGAGSDPAGEDPGVDQTKIPLLGFRIPFSFSFGH